MKIPLAFVVLVALRLSSGGGVPPEYYKDAFLADNPFAYYRLAELANTEPVADEAGNNPGVYVNDPKVEVPGPIATDPRNTAVSFTRADQQYIRLTKLGRFGSSLSSGFSAEFWLRMADSSDRQTIFDSNNPHHGRTALTCDIAGDNKEKQLRPFCRDDHSNRFEADFYPEGNNVDIYDDRWHYIVFVYDPHAPALSDQVLLYVDASRQQITMGQKKAAPKLSDFDEPVTLAASDPRDSVRYYLEGSLDEVAFDLSPLSEAQVMNHYRAAGEVVNSK